MIRSSDGGADSPWSPREAELLAVTLELLQEHGYDRLTVDAVATTARARGITLSLRPTAWDGSPMMGKWDSALMTGMAEMSNVFLV